MKKTKKKRDQVERVLGEEGARAGLEGKGPDEKLASDPPGAAGQVNDEARSGEAAAEPDDQVQELQAKVETLEDGLLRAKADYQNLVRRSALERSEAVRYANAELMRSLLGVLDDFERSVVAAGNSDNLASVVDGVRLVHENLLNALRNHGLERIEALHRPFDPHVHEAMMQQPSAEHPPGTVLEEVAKGYQLRDRVIRPAKVVVSSASGEELAERAPEEE